MTKAEELILENRRQAANFRFPEPQSRLPLPVSFNPPKRRRTQTTPETTPPVASPSQPEPTSKALVPISEPTSETQNPHPPWSCYRVISGHLGWPRCVAFDPSNYFFATGSSDRTIKLWNSATGRLKLTLTGHVSTVRSIKFSENRPYMFTASEDKFLKCWDLERNTVIRNYHGHLSAIYSLALHPTLDVAITGGRDSTVRVWDIRSRRAVFVLGGHRDTVQGVLANEVDPQIISASADQTIRFWDLAKGRTTATLTHHKKGIRGLGRHPGEFSFVSAAADGLRTWALPGGGLMRTFGGGLVNGVEVNQDGVVCTARDDGAVEFWSFEKGERICRDVPKLQPGSLDAENAVLGCGFDRSGSRVVTCHADKTVRMWKEDVENWQ